MSAPNKEFSNTVRIFLLGAPLLLAACTSDFGPFPLPTGYHYHNERVKTPPGPEPVFHHHEGHAAEDCPEIHVPPAHASEHAHAMALAPVEADGEMVMLEPVAVMPGHDIAASDLVQRLVDQFGKPVEPVYVVPSTGTAQEAGFAVALHAALEAHDFHVAAMSGHSPFTLTYAIGMPGSVGGRSLVKITLSGQEGVLNEQSGLYDLGAPEMADPAAPAPADTVGDVPADVTVIVTESPEPAPSSGAPLPLGPD